MQDILNAYFNIIQVAISRDEFSSGESQRSGIYPMKLLPFNKGTIDYAVSTDNKEN